MTKLKMSWSEIETDFEYCCNVRKVSEFYNKTYSFA